MLMQNNNTLHQSLQQTTAYLNWSFPQAEQALSEQDDFFKSAAH